MSAYVKTIETVNEYLSKRDFVRSEQSNEGKYRLVVNNCLGRESFIAIKVDEKTGIISYKMYYNVRAGSRGERRSLSEYFIMANNKAENYICFAGIESNGSAAYVEIKHNYELFPINSEQLRSFERICAVRIARDTILVKEVI